MVRPSENGQRMASSTSGISLVLQLLAKQDALSRIELARLTGLTPSAITTVVQKLLQLDLIKEAGKK